MSKRNVVVKGVDEELYRRAKAKAALLGLKIPDAINEALKKWLESEEELPNMEETANRRLLESEFPRLMEDYEGKYVAVAKSRVLGVYDTIEEAFQAIKSIAKEGAHQGYVTKIEPKKTLTLEMGMAIYDVYKT
jgi:antitoxin component of RelBE/YafQ-DinJ toxin-antitoxin module